eukprot:scaffold95919_cov55-Phaeocystis_antarctica.AAC.1
MVPELAPGRVDILVLAFRVVVLVNQKPRLADVVGRMARVIEPVDVGEGQTHCPAAECGLSECGLGGNSVLQEAFEVVDEANPRSRGRIHGRLAQCVLRFDAGHLCMRSRVLTAPHRSTPTPQHKPFRLLVSSKQRQLLWRERRRRPQQGRKHGAPTTREVAASCLIRVGRGKEEE